MKLTVPFLFRVQILFVYVYMDLDNWPAEIQDKLFSKTFTVFPYPMTHDATYHMPTALDRSLEHLSVLSLFPSLGYAIPYIDIPRTHTTTFFFHFLHTRLSRTTYMTYMHPYIHSKIPIHQQEPAKATQLPQLQYHRHHSIVEEGRRGEVRISLSSLLHFFTSSLPWMVYGYSIV